MNAIARLICHNSQNLKSKIRWTQVSINALVQGAISGDYIVSFPTDTVPALAARPDRAELIFAAKRRSQDKTADFDGSIGEGFVALRAGKSSRVKLVAASSRILLAGGV